MNNEVILALVSILSPTVLGILTFMIIRYMKNQDTQIKTLTDSINSLTLKITLQEERSLAIAKGLSELNDIRRDITLLQSETKAAWKVIDHTAQKIDKIEERQLRQQ